MKDIHNHLLYGIDDGSKSLDESLKLLKDMEECGVKEVVLTPHYIVDSKYQADPETKNKLLNELKNELVKKNIDIKLYLGNEIYLDDNLLKYLKDKKIDSINNSKYLLIEFSMSIFPKHALNVFSELIYNGYKIILAHPERYNYLYKDMSLLNELKEMGVLFQSNYGSLFGMYGVYPKKMIKKLLKKDYIDFIAGDIHHSVSLDLNKLKKKLKRYISEERIEDLLNNNFDKVIKDEEI